MGFRRSPDRTAAARAWKHFVDRNAHFIGAFGLPPAATATIEAWDDLLMHGFLADDPGRFAVDQLTSQQYRSLVELSATTSMLATSSTLLWRSSLRIRLSCELASHGEDCACGDPRAAS